MHEATHYIIWSTTGGTLLQTRKSHQAMETLVNNIVSNGSYIKGSLKIIVGFEELKITDGKEYA